MYLYLCDRTSQLSVSIHASYSGGPRFQFRPDEQHSWLRLPVSSSAPPGNSVAVHYNGSLLLHNKFFSTLLSEYSHPTVYINLQLT